jgi:hypothetical protein
METEIRSINIPKENFNSKGLGTMPWKPVTGLKKAIGDSKY